MPLLRSLNRNRVRARVAGFSLVEMMVVVVIIGIISSLAIPNLVAMAKGFGSKADSEQVLAAFRSARSLSIRLNLPVRMVQSGRTLTLERATTTTSAEAFLVAIDDAAWVPHRTIALGDVSFSTFPADGFRFCPSGEARFRETTVDGTPVCPLGDLLSPASNVPFDIGGIKYEIELRGALGSSRLRLVQ